MGSFIHAYTDGGGIRECRVPDDFSGIGSVPFILKFPGFKKCLLASLAASGNQASRTSNIVTITATAHGIPTGSTYVGFRFFYPGSASLAAGWYDSITDVQTNTISFNAPGANFGSENVNGGVAYTTLTDVASLTVPAAFMSPGTNMSLVGYSGGDTTSATKQIRTYLNTLNVHTHGVTTTPFVRFQGSNILVEGGKSYGHSGFDNLSSVTEYLQNITLGADGTLLVKASLSAASAFIYIPTMELTLS
jgi:hypothetical protein